MHMEKYGRKTQTTHTSRLASVHKFNNGIIISDLRVVSTKSHTLDFQHCQLIFWYVNAGALLMPCGWCDACAATAHIHSRELTTFRFFESWGPHNESQKRDFEWEKRGAWKFIEIQWGNAERDKQWKKFRKSLCIQNSLKLIIHWQQQQLVICRLVDDDDSLDDWNESFSRFWPTTSTRCLFNGSKPRTRHTAYSRNHGGGLMCRIVIYSKSKKFWPISVFWTRKSC